MTFLDRACFNSNDPLPHIFIDSLSKELDKSFGGLKEVLATSRKFVAKVHDALNTTAAPSSSIDELNALLEELRQQPILLRVSAIASCLCPASIALPMLSLSLQA